MIGSDFRRRLQTKRPAGGRPRADANGNRGGAFAPARGSEGGGGESDAPGDGDDAGSPGLSSGAGVQVEVEIVEGGRSERGSGSESVSDSDSGVRGESTRVGALVLISALLFAVMGELSHALGPRCDWTLTAFCRSVFMLGTTLTLAWRAGARLRFARPGTLWVRSVAGTFGMLCNFYALALLPVADVLTLTNTFPLWIALLSWIWLRQPLTRGELACVGLGVAGVALIQRPHFAEFGWTVALALASSVSTAIAMIGLNRLKSVDPRAVVAHFAGVATVVVGIAALIRWNSHPPAIWDATTVGMLLGVGLTGTAAQILLTIAYASGHPGRLAVIGLSQVVFALVIDAMAWGRALSVGSAIGFAMVLAPTAWIMGRAGMRAAGAARRRGGGSPETVDASVQAGADLDSKGDRREFPA